MRAALGKVQDETIAYGPAEGLPPCRAAWRKYYTDTGLALSDAEFVVTTAGSEALLFALAAVANPGDRVLVPEPLYANNLGFATILGIEIVPIPCTVENGYHLPEDLASYLQPRTRAILYANPGNPTGAVYRRRELERIAALAQEHDLFVIADEVYREFVYAPPEPGSGVLPSGRSLSVLELPGLEERAILVDSFSKRYSLCGARIGAIASRNAELMAAVRRFAMARLSPPVVGQLVAAAAVEVGSEYFAGVRATYRKRRDLAVKALRAIPGVSCPEPEGAFYVMARLPIPDAEAFVKFLLESFAIAGETTMLAPANGFYATPGAGESEVRVAYVLDEEPLARALRIVAEGLAAFQAANRSPVATARASQPAI
jgi:aspartate aminotransferase